MTIPRSFAQHVDQLASRASAWVQAASAADLWHVMEHGGLDARVGMPDVMPDLGFLPGPGATFRDQLALRGWLPAVQGHADALVEWFAADQEAQAAARHELQRDIAEMLFAFGGTEWVSVTFPSQDAQTS